MIHPPILKEKAISLRKQGYSIKEISKQLGIAQSTSSLWLSKIELDSKATNRISQRRAVGRSNALVTRRNKRLHLLEGYLQNGEKLVNELILNKFHSKLLCALLFWAEGEKSQHYVTFINSDPSMIITFLSLLRKSFKIDENKLRALVHIHEYHNDLEIKKLWSRITKIPLSQFYKSYSKPHTGKNTREGYKGSISIRYYDYRIALELHAIYNGLAKKYTGVG